MRKNVLITGYTDFITEQFLATAFPNCRIVIAGNTQQKASRKSSISVYKGDLTAQQCHKLFGAYDFDSVVFISGSAAPFGTLNGAELEQLSLVLEYCGEGTKLIYIMGPEHPAEDPATVLEAAARTLCRRFADRVNVLLSPWIYERYANQPTLNTLFSKGSHDLPFPADQVLTFLAAEDLAVLLFRMLDRWQAMGEPIIIVNAFADTMGRFVETVQQETGSRDITYRYAEKPAYSPVSPSNTILQSQYHWFPVYSFFDDLPELLRRVLAQGAPSHSPILEFFRKHPLLVKLLELAFGALITELLLKLNHVAVQFRMVDFRLLFIVVMGILYDMRMGIAAAALESVSLVLAYLSTGMSGLALFYEPGNWFPFIAYFTVGSLCGYIRSKDLTQLQFAKDEINSLTSRYQYLTSLSEDVLLEKREYKQQILGSQDSFGKLFAITQQLDSSHPQHLLSAAIDVIERVMSNRTVALYRCCDGKPYARLSLSSRGTEFPLSLQMDRYYAMLESVPAGCVWVNRELDSTKPRYLYAVRKEGKIQTLILLQDAQYSQMTLYYENLFRILCGLISGSLLRANAYQDAIHRSHCVEGTENVLSAPHFAEELSCALHAKEKKLATHLVLRIENNGLSAAETEQRLFRCIRFSDTVGCWKGRIYVILLQARPDDLQGIGRRLRDTALKYTPLSAEEQAELIQWKES